MANPLLDAIGYLGSSLDKPGRAVRGLLAGKPGEGLAALPFSDTLGITDPANATSGRDLLKALGMVGDKEGDGFDLGDAAGMGVEMALDPTNYLGGALVKRALGVRGAAKENNALRAALLEKNAMPEEIAGLTKAVNAEGQPARVYHGTGAVFDKYDLGKADPEALYGPGIYTTDSPRIAAGYAEAKSKALTGKPGAIGDVIDMNRRRVAEYEKMIAELAPAAEKSPFAKARLDSATASRDLFLKAISEHEQRLASLPKIGENVRMNFIDTRSPFNIDQAVPLEDLKKLDEAGGNVFHGMSVHDVNRMSAAQEAGRDFSMPGHDVYGLLRDAEYFKPGGRRNSAAVANDVIGNAGFDSIMHVGGDNTGNLPHQVIIGLDPSKIYSPYIAPALQQVPSQHRPLLAALLGENAATRLGRAG